MHFLNFSEDSKSPPVLGHLNDSADIEVHTNTGNVGIGAVLVQTCAGRQQVIAYASCSVSKTEANYSATEKEFVWTTTKFRRYLYDRPFKVVTDHHALYSLTNLE